MKNIYIHTDYIELQSLLKLADIIHSGGEAKYFLSENDVLVNGETERRRGRKLYPGDKVTFGKEEYLVCSNVDKKTDTQ